MISKNPLIALTDIEEDQILELQQLSTVLYTHYFGDYWESNGLHLYLQNEFGHERLVKDLANPDIDYQFIAVDRKHVGFIKIYTESNPKLSSIENCELEKIYILPDQKGKGLGSSIMQMIVENMKVLGKDELILHVVDSNFAAIGFYQKLGFEFRGNSRISAPLFKDELRGMHQMVLKLD